MIHLLKFYGAAIFCATVIFINPIFDDTHNNSKIDLRGQNTVSEQREFISEIQMSESMLGIWSGKHITLEITPQGASVEYDCAHGEIGEKIILDKENHFKVRGIQIDERGGPARMNDSPKEYSVNFTGSVKGTKMTLTVARTDNNKIVGKFFLVRGRESNLVKCR